MAEIPKFTCPYCHATYIPRVENPVRCSRCGHPLKSIDEKHEVKK